MSRLKSHDLKRLHAMHCFLCALPCIFMVVRVLMSGMMILLWSDFYSAKHEDLLSKQTAFLINPLQSFTHFDAHDQLGQAVRSSQIDTVFAHCLCVAKMQFVSVKVGCSGLSDMKASVPPGIALSFSHTTMFSMPLWKGSVSMSLGVAVCDTSLQWLS